MKLKIIENNASIIAHVINQSTKGAINFCKHFANRFKIISSQLVTFVATSPRKLLFPWKLTANVHATAAHCSSSSSCISFSETKISEIRNLLLVRYYFVLNDYCIINWCRFNNLSDYNQLHTRWGHPWDNDIWRTLFRSRNNLKQNKKIHI